MGHSIFKADYPLMINWFKAKGYSGSLNEMIIAYFKTLVGNVNGYPNDLIARQMNSLGFTGNVGDMLNSFFCQKTGATNPNEAARLFFADSSLDFNLGIGGIDANTLVMLHMDGANGGTVFTDSAPTPNTWTARGGAVTDTGTKKFGTASGNFIAATSSYIDCPHNAALKMTGAFTIDAWINLTSKTADGCLYEHNPGDAREKIEVSINGTTNVVTFVFRAAAVYTLIFTFPFTPTNGTQYHLAVVRIDTGNAATSWKGFVNGVGQTLTKTFGNWNAAFPNVSGTPTIGRSAHFSYLLDGHIDEFRISNVARWTADFTPPTSAYTT